MKKILIATTAAIFFIELLDTTILYSCSVPIAHDFGVNSARISLPIISYIIGTCILMPAVNWLTNRYNKLNIMLFTLAIFSAFSVFCGISQGIYAFAILRFFQGLSISIAAATALIALLPECNAEEIVKVMAVINIPTLMGTAIGPFFGAIAAYYISWRVAFIINFPIGIIIFYALFLVKLKTKFSFSVKLEKTKFDVLGFVLLSISLMLVSFGFEQLSHEPNLLNLVIVLGGGIFATAYVLLWFKRKNHSILDLAIFRNKGFLFGAITNLVARSSMCGIPILLGIILQEVHKFSIIRTGAYLGVIAVGGIGAKLISALITKIGIQRSTALAVFFTAISIALFVPLNFWIASNLLWLICFLFGFSMSFLYTSMNSIMLITLEKNEVPNASNIRTMMNQVTTGFGVTFAVGGMQLLLAAHGLKSVTINYAMSNQAFSLLCIILSAFMLSNLLVAYWFWEKKRN